VRIKKSRRNRRLFCVSVGIVGRSVDLVDIDDLRHSLSMPNLWTPQLNGNTEEVLRAISMTTHDHVFEHTQDRAQCIRAAAIQTRLLQELGFESVRPLAAWGYVCRPDLFEDFVATGNVPDDGIVDLGGPPSEAGRTWTGHVLVAVVEDDQVYLLDATADQSSRPEQGLIVPGGLVFTTPLWNGEKWPNKFTQFDMEEAKLLLQSIPSDRHYETSRYWTDEEQNRHLTDKIVRSLQDQGIVPSQFSMQWPDAAVADNADTPSVDQPQAVDASPPALPLLKTPPTRATPSKSGGPQESTPAVTEPETGTDISSHEPTAGPDLDF
jgi:hypothetical protein